MKINIFILLTMFVFITNTGFSQTFKIFTSSKYRYEFKYQEGWYPFSEDLREITEQKMKELTGKNINIEFALKNLKVNEVTYPNILVQPFPTNGNYYSDLKKKFYSKAINELKAKSNAKVFNLIQEMKVGEPIHDDERNLIMFTSEVTDALGNESVNLTAMFFAHNRAVQFVFTTLKSDYFRYKESYSFIIDSFKFK